MRPAFSPVPSATPSWTLRNSYGKPIGEWSYYDLDELQGYFAAAVHGDGVECFVCLTAPTALHLRRVADEAFHIASAEEGYFLHRTERDLVGRGGVCLSPVCDVRVSRGGPFDLPRVTATYVRNDLGREVQAIMRARGVSLGPITSPGLFGRGRSSWEALAGPLSCMGYARPPAAPPK